MSAVARTIDFKTSWGNFVDDVGQRKGGWDWYATLTFRDPPMEDVLRGWTKVGMGYSKHACDGFLRLLGEDTLPPASNPVKLHSRKCYNCV